MIVDNVWWLDDVSSTTMNIFVIVFVIYDYGSLNLIFKGNIQIIIIIIIIKFIIYCPVLPNMLFLLCLTPMTKTHLTFRATIKQFSTKYICENIIVKDYCYA